MIYNCNLSLSHRYGPVSVMGRERGLLDVRKASISLCHTNSTHTHTHEYKHTHTHTHALADTESDLIFLSGRVFFRADTDIWALAKGGTWPGRWRLTWAQRCTQVDVRARGLGDNATLIPGEGAVALGPWAHTEESAPHSLHAAALQPQIHTHTHTHTHTQRHTHSPAVFY